MCSVHGQTQPSTHTMHQVCDCVRENIHTSMNNTFMDLVTPQPLMDQLPT
jgi:hypothetical protein